jgi:hypothetical protein
VAANKASFERLTQIVDTGDVELIATTIDKAFEPDVQIATLSPVAAATGADALKQVRDFRFERSRTRMSPSRTSEVRRLVRSDRHVVGACEDPVVPVDERGGRG